MRKLRILTMIMILAATGLAQTATPTPVKPKDKVVIAKVQKPVLKEALPGQPQAKPNGEAKCPPCTTTAPNCNGSGMNAVCGTDCKWTCQASNCDPNEHPCQ